MKCLNCIKKYYAQFFTNNETDFVGFKYEEALSIFL